jgi:L-ornithine N5-oxygenase
MASPAIPAEISDYLQWVAESLSSVRSSTAGAASGSRACARRTARTLTGWLVHTDGSTIAAGNVVVGTGREPWIPPEL